MSEIFITRGMRLSDAPEVAKLYASVFAGPPWNENTKCDRCDGFFGLSTNPGESCSSSGCAGILQEAYPLKPTIGQIVKDLTRDGGQGVVISRVEGKSEDISAFTWGFRYRNPEEFVAEKYIGSEPMMTRVPELVNRFGTNNWIFYVSECGVEERYRGRGWSNNLFLSLCGGYAYGETNILMRTNMQSPMIAVGMSFGMEQLLGPRVSIDRTNRLILASSEAANGAWDEVNRDRVLFLGNSSKMRLPRNLR